jgi:branched-chain amino acid transport system substrate-binding protein
VTNNIGEGQDDYASFPIAVGCGHRRIFRPRLPGRAGGEQTRRLVEQEQVAFIFGSLGTPTNAAIHSYLNDNKVPQLLIASGAAMFGDPQRYPWTMGFGVNYQTEAHVFAKHILMTKPDAKIG